MPNHDTKRQVQSMNGRVKRGSGWRNSKGRLGGWRKGGPKGLASWRSKG